MLDVRPGGLYSLMDCRGLGGLKLLSWVWKYKLLKAPPGIGMLNGPFIH